MANQLSGFEFEQLRCTHKNTNYKQKICAKTAKHTKHIVKILSPSDSPISMFSASLRDYVE